VTFVFRCTHCHAEHTAAASIAGRKVRCPDCFEIVTAVESDNVLDEPPRQNDPTADTVVLSERDAGLNTDDFDPYEQWLSIPPEEQPPNFYRLLDLPAFEPDSYVISGAADRQIAKVRAVKDGQWGHLKDRLIEEINRARACLTDPEQKATYDRRVHKQFKKLKQAEAEQQKTEETVKESGRAVESVPEPDAVNPQSETQDQKEPVDEPAAETKTDSEDATTATAGSDVEGLETVKHADNRDAVVETADAPQPTAAAPPPEVAPPPVIQAPPVLSSDVGVRALMHVDDEDDEAGDAFVSFADDRTEFESEMDMTPMVDVTFLLLIFFMVTASFSLQKSIEQPVQKQDEPSTNVTQEEFEDNPDYVVVQIDEFDSYRVIAADFDEEAPSEQELLIKLRRARDGRGGRVPTKLLVTAHGEASHGRVVMALDAGTEVGMEQVQFTLAAESDF